MLIGITRDVSLSLSRCELTFIERKQIDVVRARFQHANYKAALANLGVRTISLEAENHLPDAVFVEDGAVVVDEVAVITTMGCSSREPEIETLARSLGEFLPLKFIKRPAILEGGDVLRIGRDIYVGLSRRTNEEAVSQLHQILRPFGYRIVPLPVKGCLHLKTGVSYIGRRTILANPEWIDTSHFHDLTIMHVSTEEPWAANALCIHDHVLFPVSFPKTRNLLEEAGFKVLCIDVGEFQNAEAGVTCLSIVFEHGA